jgi:ABC-type lipoprotein export system ATPase subunit
LHAHLRFSRNQFTCEADPFTCEQRPFTCERLAADITCFGYHHHVANQRVQGHAGWDLRGHSDARREREVLALREVSKSYRVGPEVVQAIRGASLAVERGELAAVLGRRYEGKSTLLRLAAGLEQPDLGEVLFCGARLDVLGRAQREALLGSRIAWVDRSDASAGMTVAEQVSARLPGRRARSETDTRAASALEHVGGRSIAGSRWADLSRWEHLLASLAIGLASSPDLLLIDDLLGGLNRTHVQDAGRLLHRLARVADCAVLISVDDPEAALCADRTWSFRGGRLRPVFKAAGVAEVIDFSAHQASR